MQFIYWFDMGPLWAHRALKGTWAHGPHGPIWPQKALKGTWAHGPLGPQNMSIIWHIKQNSNLYNHMDVFI